MWAEAIKIEARRLFFATRICQVGGKKESLKQQKWQMTASFCQYNGVFGSLWCPDFCKEQKKALLLLSFVHLEFLHVLKMQQ